MERPQPLGSHATGTGQFVLAIMIAKLQVRAVGLRKAILLLGMILAAALLFALTRGTHEPSFQGKSLSEWLAEYEQNPAVNEEAANAVRQIGTDAIPFLLSQLQATDSKVKAFSTKLVGPSVLNKLGFSNAAQQRRWGYSGFLILGASAKPAIPHLIQLLNNHSTTYDAACALTFLYPEGARALTNVLRKPDGGIQFAVLFAIHNHAMTGLKPEDAPIYVPALTPLLDDENSDTRSLAAEILAFFNYRREEVAPALVKLLNDPEMSPRVAAAKTLGQFGVQAKAAVPALVEYAKRAGGATECENAIQAIEKIDPKAAEELKTN